MAIRDKLRANESHLLQPGESIQAVFCAQSVSAYFSQVSVWIVILSNAYRVVVTDRRIMVCRSRG